jgi:hypothetical protein
VALLLIGEFLRGRLFAVEPPLTWRNGAPGDVGLPRQLPDGVPTLRARLERLVDAEVQRWAIAQQRRYFRRQQQQSSAHRSARRPG